MNILDDAALQRFLKVRTIIFLVALLILNFVFIDKKWSTAAGLICGSLLGMLKFAVTSKYISGEFRQGEKRPTQRNMFVKYLLIQPANILLIAVSIYFGLRFFFGVVGGVLLLPVIILINIFTEALGLSHNNFQLRRCENGRFWRKNCGGNVK